MGWKASRGVKTTRKFRQMWELNFHQLNPFGVFVRERMSEFKEIGICCKEEDLI